MEKFKCMVTCAAGIEALVGREIRNLDIECAVENGRAIFQGTIQDIAKLSINLRTADRIKIILAEFEARTFEELFDYVKGIEWEKYLPLDANFPVSGKSIKSKLFSVSDCQAITKKAIVERLREFYHRYGRLPESGAKYPIEVAIRKDKAVITLDTTGDSLFKRGYRVDKGGAPLKENLAASLVMLTNWKKDMPFADLTCGSGTIPIEAALYGLNIAPGLHRKFLCETWSFVDETVFFEERQKAEAKIDTNTKLDILGTDIDHRMIEVACENMKRAGLEGQINFKQMRLQDFTTTKENGVIVCNPPYGERLSDTASVEELYRNMGEVFGKLPTWSKYILTSNLRFEEFYGNKATKKRKLYNGALRTDFFQYWAKRK